MTSFAFIFGVIPLVVASGAGAEMRRSLGIAVFSGMVGVTLFGIFLTPVFFYVIQGLSETRLFMSAAVRWVGSTVVGGLAGSGLGYLLSRGRGRSGCTGGSGSAARRASLASLAVLGIHKRLRVQPTAAGQVALATARTRRDLGVPIRRREPGRPWP